MRFKAETPPGNRLILFTAEETLATAAPSLATFLPVFHSPMPGIAFGKKFVIAAPKVNPLAEQLCRLFGNGVLYTQLT